MKQKFVAYTLMLCLLLIVAMPAQVFAATNNTCNYNNNSYIVNVNCNYNNNSSATKANTNSNNYNYNYSNNKSNCKYDCKYDNKCNYKNDCYSANCKYDCKNANCKYNNCTKSNCNSNKNCTTNACAKKPVKPETPEVIKPENPNTEKPKEPDAPANNAALNDYEQQVVDLVNKERKAAGLSPLKVNVKLSEMARVKAADMRDNNYFSHTSPVYGSPFEMMNKFGIKYSAAGENIAKGQQTPESVMRAWMNSSGHKANILNSKYDQIGVGFVKDNKGNTYWVQEFIK